MATTSLKKQPWDGRDETLVELSGFNTTVPFNYLYFLLTKAAYLSVQVDVNSVFIIVTELFFLNSDMNSVCLVALDSNSIWNWPWWSFGGFVELCKIPSGKVLWLDLSNSSVVVCRTSQKWQGTAEHLSLYLIKCSSWLTLRKQLYSTLLDNLRINIISLHSIST